ncbi:iron chelate uptake ABC transporter family permease subunit, partial [Sutterella sp.]|uniref:iron chelate uptake ABC transporter family permease subunit n=1 Tax=Sutterella sp. TaxID=1981025 RepID=UPI0026E01E03
SSYRLSNLPTRNSERPKREFAESRGLPMGPSAFLLLALCALSSAVATAAMGPVAFIGLVAPHLALMMGAARVKAQILTAAAAGAVIVAAADGAGQVLIAPAQIPAGTLAAILGAGYFLVLLLASRLKARRGRI